MSNSGYRVDFTNHGAFCLEAERGGYLSADDLSLLNLYPNGYGLYQLVDLAVERVGSSLQLNLGQMLTEDQQKLLSKHLSSKHIEVGYASTIALACAEAGLLNEAQLAPVVANVRDSGEDLLRLAHESLDALIPEDLRLEPSLSDDETYEVIGTAIHGEHLYLVATDRMVINLKFPELTSDFLPIHIILVKTLDLMSRHLVPFNTPASAMGYGSLYCCAIDEAYQGMENVVDMSNPMAIANYLETTPSENFPFEAEMIGLFDEGDGLTEEAINHAVYTLSEMHELRTDFGYSVANADEPHEVPALILQAKEIRDHGSEHRELLEVLIEALELCKRNRDEGYYFDESNFPGSEDVGLRFFDCIWVEVDEKFPNLSCEALDYFNSYAQECAEVCVGLPIGNAEVLAQDTLKIMDRTRQCLDLLTRIQSSLKAAPHAQ
ncbi:hypothetical protein ACSVIJ_04105 [Pseudomonas sp. NCHU5208]|uniref:hypothetical protein n=1 Tax=unclassified Pseudomonas TaxID=196821 RepID=UPI003F9BF51B